MANLSDAYGKITVEKVAKEFVEYLNVAQGAGAYYLLCEDSQYKYANIDEDNSMSFAFSSFGRWNFGSNLEGYLDGNWMQSDEEKAAYNKFIEALTEKEGRVLVEYHDSDPAMGWMGEGVAQLEVVDGAIRFQEEFTDKELTISSFAKSHNSSQEWALEYIYGEEAAEEYDKYVKIAKNPVTPEEWFNSIYEG